MTPPPDAFALGFTYDPDGPHYTAEIKTRGRTVPVTVLADEPETVPAFGRAVEIVRGLDQLIDVAEERAVWGLLNIKNESWRDLEEPEVTPDEFRAALAVEGVWVHEDGSAEVYFAAGDLFWGHAVVVQFDEAGQFVEASTAG